MTHMVVSKEQASEENEGLYEAVRLHVGEGQQVVIY